MAWELIDNIRGPKGDKGDKGTINSISVATLPPESSATATLSGTTDVHVHFGIPRGAKGEQGVPGTLSSASAESVAAEEPAEVIMSGTTEVKHAHFKVPRGLPGTNAIENDSAVAAYILAVDSEVKAALNADYPVKRVWTGSAYPARVPGAVNLFIGPVDPGLAMTADDVWANPDLTTVAEVVAAILDPSHAAFAAVRAVADVTAVSVPVAVRSGDAATLKNASGSGEFYGFECANGATTVLGGSIPVPRGWKTANVRVRFYVPSSSSGGDVRLARAAALHTHDAAPVLISEAQATVTPTVGATRVSTLGGVIDLAGHTTISVSVRRAGTTGTDTMANPIYILGVDLGKVT